MNEVLDIVGRHEKVAFAGVKGADDNIVYRRMQGFTSLAESKNPEERNIKYVDEPFKRTNVVGYDPSISYGFDEAKDDPVQEAIIDITDNEKIGAAAIISILNVNMTKEGAKAGEFKAALRNFSVIPGSSGDDENVWTYSGDLKANGERITGTATTTDGWKTCTFTEDTDA